MEDIVRGLIQRPSVRLPFPNADSNQLSQFWGILISCTSLCILCIRFELNFKVSIVKLVCLHMAHLTFSSFASAFGLRPLPRCCESSDSGLKVDPQIRTVLWWWGEVYVLSFWIWAGLWLTCNQQNVRTPKTISEKLQLLCLALWKHSLEPWATM